jgi:hypothetical protein
MRKAIQVTPWPNKLGFDVGRDAEVWVLEDGLMVRIITRAGRVKALFIPDPSLDPVRAVRRCWREGEFEEEQ